MKTVYSILLISAITLACGNQNKQEAPDNRNEVMVLGTIHSGHLTRDEYDLDVLRSLIMQINPDIILTEIPPDRFPTALKEFTENDTIMEPRVIRFPEYIDVIFPLSKIMNFEIIPTAGWTREMADARSAKLKAISEDSIRTSEWEELNMAAQLSDSLIKATGREFDPYWIDTNEYDSLVNIELSVYNKLFNEELGLGGWDNINVAHYSNIEKALEKYKNQGKRVLITYGAGHKGWFLKELRKRDDIKLLYLKDLVSSETE